MNIFSECQTDPSRSLDELLEGTKTYRGIGNLLFTRYRHLLFFLFSAFIFSVTEVQGQEIHEVNEYIKANGFQSSDPFMDLRYGSGGIMEISAGGTVMPKNPAPKNLIINASDLSSLPSEEGQYGSVQFMQINLSEGASFSLNYTQLVSFPGLRYLLLVTPSPLTEAQISQMLLGFAESGIVILYQISRPG